MYLDPLGKSDCSLRSGSLFAKRLVLGRTIMNLPNISDNISDKEVVNKGQTMSHHQLHNLATSMGDKTLKASDLGTSQISEETR